MYVEMRDGSACHDLKNLIPAITPHNYRRCLLCSDDRQPKTMIEESIEVPFETLNVSIQKNYDALLRNYFGDYMQFPPEEEQHSNHLIAYINLNERESYDDVIAKVKKLRRKKR